MKKYFYPVFIIGIVFLTLSAFFIPKTFVFAADPTPTITSINPSTIHLGDQVEIVGNNFGDSQPPVICPILATHINGNAVIPCGVLDGENRPQRIVSWSNILVQVIIDNTDAGRTDNIRIVKHEFISNEDTTREAFGRVTILPPSCTADTWSCGDWNACSVSGSQTRTCNKTFDCSSTDTPSPQTSQSCTPPTQPKPITPPPVYQPPQPTCTADTWSCGDWNSCSLSGVQNRSCRKTFDCPSVETAPPVTDQYCEAPNRPTQQVPQDSSAISNQDAIIKATVKLICPLDENKAIQGSGTVIDSSGIILTNKHVISGTLGCLVGFINDFNDEPYFGDRQIADIQKVSSNEDVAILKLRNPQNKKLTYINVANSNSNFRLGTKVNIYGYPAKFGTNITYTSGDFSGTSGSYLKTTAIIEHGNSGGGAYFNDGNFIGVPTAVIKGELNALGYILSINTINAWLGNSSIAYSGNGNQNNYSRVSSILEDIDLKKLNSLELVIPGTKQSKEIINKAIQSSPTAPPSVMKKTGPSQIQKESTIIQPTDTNKKINPEQNNPAPSVKEQKPNAPWIKRLFHWLVNLF